MSLVTTEKMLSDAKAGKYAVPALNFENMDMARAIIEKCAELNSPVILQTTSSTLEYLPAEIAFQIVRYFALDEDIPIALHLDHGKNFTLAKRCIKAGYTSVMIDGSGLDFDENVRVSREVADYAKEFRIPVECEIGKVGGKEESEDDDSASLTDPHDAKRFAELTGCSSLAVAVGTAHGFYTKPPKLDFQRIRETASLIDIPLVLHGTSGTRDEDVKKAISLGMCKVNYATDLRVKFTEGVRASLKDEKTYDPKAYLKEGSVSLMEHVARLVSVCGSENRA